MNINKMMKEAQKMQAKMTKMQEEMKERVLETEAGGGMIKLSINGERKITALKIDPEAVDPDDVTMLEDLIIVAVNSAIDKIGEFEQEELGKITGGMKIPGMF